MTPRDLTQRRRILFTMLTALTFRYPSGREPALIPALRAWFGGWPGIGRITVGMARQGYDLQRTRYAGEGWRSTFFPGRAHSLTRRPGPRGNARCGRRFSGRRGIASGGGKTKRRVTPERHISRLVTG